METLRVIYYIIGIIFVILGLIIILSGSLLGLIIGLATITVAIYLMNKVRKNGQIIDIQHRLRRSEEDRGHS